MQVHVISMQKCIWQMFNVSVIILHYQHYYDSYNLYYSYHFENLIKIRFYNLKLSLVWSMVVAENPSHCWPLVTISYMQNIIGCTCMLIATPQWQFVVHVYISLPSHCYSWFIISYKLLVPPYILSFLHTACPLQYQILPIQQHTHIPINSIRSMVHYGTGNHHILSSVLSFCMSIVQCHI